VRPARIDRIRALGTSLSVAAAQPPVQAKNVALNAVTHAEAVMAAKARLVVFPELSLTGYELDAGPVVTTDPALSPIVAACAATGSVALVGAPIEEGRRRFIALLRVDGSGVDVAYRKSHVGGDEVGRFSAGDGPTVIEIDGWRIGLGICKDTGVAGHTAGTAALGVDVYAAGLVHAPEELEEQDARGRRIAATCDAHVVFASFAGATGGGFDETAGASTIWAPDGSVVARATDAPGDIAHARLDGGRRREAVGGGGISPREPSVRGA
jgi:predicted amidohydrolase